MIIMKKKLMYLMILPALLLFIAIPANAIPVLQLYLEGGTYDPVTEDWVVGPTTEATLWVIGNISGPGGKGTIYDVKLAAAFDSADSPTIALDQTTTSGFGGFTDPSTPIAPTLTPGGPFSGAPTLSDGSSLPSHGIYGPGTSFLEWSLGNFFLTDSPVGDFIDLFPTSLFPAAGQINAYDISFSGADELHFDAWGDIAGNPHGGLRPVFAPFSHDATVVPEPATLVLLGSGLLGFGLLGRKRFKRPRT